MYLGEITLTPQTEKPYEVLMSHFVRLDKLRFKKDPQPGENRVERQARLASEQSLPDGPNKGALNGARVEGFHNLLREICFQNERTAGLEYETHNGDALHIMIRNPELKRTVSLHAVANSDNNNKYESRIYLHGESTEQYEFPETASKREYRAKSRIFVKDALEHLLE